VSTQARQSPWGAFSAFNLGNLGISLLKPRSLWLAGISLLVNFYRRHSHKEK